MKPDWVLAARSLGSLDARMTARWVLGSQGPGFPGEDSEETKQRRSMSRSTNHVKLDDQGEARLGPGCQVPGFPGCQDDCPLGSW